MSEGEEVAAVCMSIVPVFLVDANTGVTFPQVLLSVNAARLGALGYGGWIE
jgi:hypothetical protein